jgi:hypothetical protein
MPSAIRTQLAIPGIATASLLAIMASVILTKPNTTYQSGVMWWFAFILTAALVVEAPVKEWPVIQLVRTCALPAACLFAGLVFRLGLQLLLFSFKAAPLVILGSGITTSANLKAELQEVRSEIGSVDWAAQRLDRTAPDAYSVALQALTPNIREAWSEFTQGNVQRNNANDLRRYLKEIAKPELVQRGEELQTQIAGTPPGSIATGQRMTLVLGLIFYTAIGLVTPIALMLAIFAKPQLQLGISFLFRTPTSKLNNLRKNLDVFLKILLVGGSIVAVFL